MPDTVMACLHGSTAKAPMTPMAFLKKAITTKVCETIWCVTCQQAPSPEPDGPIHTSGYESMMSVKAMSATPPNPKELSVVPMMG